ncbi:MAG: hypothetical protein JRI69_12550 [Deltaproteobacteria bacterium]|nr:hypothetical protein [Deltaproteobacteria bacterium]
MNTSIQNAYQKAVDKTKDQKSKIAEDDFLNLEDLLAFKHDAAERQINPGEKMGRCNLTFLSFGGKVPGTDKL